MDSFNSPTFSSLEKLIITITVMLVSVIEVLDVTIVNVSLNQMMGALGASSDEITWILTAYIVSAAIFMPLTGILIQQVGCKRLLLFNIVGFMLASIACGMATNLPEMVIFRIFQGIFGASLVPLSQYIMRVTYTRQEQNKAMTLWGIGIMVAPILGPAIGGYITEAMNWRWIFYVNVPVCAIAFIMALTFIRETPRSAAKIDWPGIFLMAIGVGALQTFLDRGNTDNWFESLFIISLACMAVLGLSLFIWRGWNKSNYIINLKIFKERNFSFSVLILMLYVMGMLGGSVLIPMMLQMLFQYPSNLAGEVMAIQGLAGMMMMTLTGTVLIKKFDHRWIIAIGTLITALGSYELTRVTVQTSIELFVLSNFIRGLGMGLVFVPLSICVFDYLDPKELGEASGLFSFGRSMGMSIGISVVTTVLTRQTQINWNHLGAHIQWFHAPFLKWIASQHLSPLDPKALSLVRVTVQQQSVMLAFLSAYWTSIMMTLLILPLLFFLKKSKIKTT